MEEQIEILRLKELSKEIGLIAEKLLCKYQTPLETLNLSNRTANALVRADIEYVEQVLKMTRSDFLRLPKFGIGCLNELTAKLKAFGFNIYPR
jgi:DNA-directed RNA polymerase alpha subunit